MAILSLTYICMSFYLDDKEKHGHRSATVFIIPIFSSDRP